MLRQTTISTTAFTSDLTKRLSEASTVEDAVKECKNFLSEINNETRSNDEIDPTLFQKVMRTPITFVDNNEESSVPPAWSYLNNDTTLNDTNDFSDISPFNVRSSIDDEYPDPNTNDIEL